MIFKAFLITGAIMFIAVLHGVDAVGLCDVPDFMIDPLFAVCFIISAIVFVMMLTLPQLILWFLLMLLGVWGAFCYVYANYVLEIICIRVQLLSYMF